MSGTLFIRIKDPAVNDVEWLVSSAQGELADSMHGPLDDAAAYAKARRVVVFAPCENILLTRVNIPTRNRQRILKAVPYMLEEQTVSDVDTMHFALGVSDGQGDIPVATVSKQDIEHWLDCFEHAGIQPNVIISEAMAVPLYENEWVVVLDDSTAIIRMNINKSLATDTDNILVFLQLLTGQEDISQPEKIRIINCLSTNDHPPFDENESNGIESEIVMEDCSHGLLAMLASAYDERTSINLMQSGYGHHEQLTKKWKKWFPSAAVLIVWVLLNAITGISESISLEKESQVLRTKITQVFKTAMPEVKRVVNPKAQLERHLKLLKKSSGTGQQDFLGLLGKTAGSFKTASGLKLRGLSYKKGRFDVEFTIKDLQALDVLKQQIEKDGLKVEILSATAKESVVLSRMRITG